MDGEGSDSDSSAEAVDFVVVRLKVATTVQTTGEPVQPLLFQPPKVEPAATAAYKVTEVSLLNLAEQVEPQLRPAGLLVTVPEPVPALLIVRV